MGVNGYFEKLSNALFVIGNSSSGIIEVPYFKIPTINIGLRQNGRFFHNSIIQCKNEGNSIRNSIAKACSSHFRSKKKNETSFWEWWYTKKKILNIIRKHLKNKHKLLHKQFKN